MAAVVGGIFDELFAQPETRIQLADALDFLVRCVCWGFWCCGWLGFGVCLFCVCVCTGFHFLHTYMLPPLTSIHTTTTNHTTNSSCLEAVASAHARAKKTKEKEKERAMKGGQAQQEEEDDDDDGDSYFTSLETSREQVRPYPLVGLSLYFFCLFVLCPHHAWSV